MCRYNRDQLVTKWCEFRCNWLNENGMSHKESQKYFGDVHCNAAEIAIDVKNL